MDRRGGHSPSRVGESRREPRPAPPPPGLTGANTRPVGTAKAAGSTWRSACFQITIPVPCGCRKNADPGQDAGSFPLTGSRHPKDAKDSSAGLRKLIKKYF